jgi:hypothetical protein
VEDASDGGVVGGEDSSEAASSDVESVNSVVSVSMTAMATAGKGLDAAALKVKGIGRFLVVDKGDIPRCSAARGGGGVTVNRGGTTVLLWPPPRAEGVVGAARLQEETVSDLDAGEEGGGGVPKGVPPLMTVV